MQVRLYFRDTPIVVQSGTSVVFLTKAPEGVYYARFYDTDGTLYEVPATDVASVDPA